MGIHLLSFFWSYFPGLRHKDRSWVSKKVPGTPAVAQTWICFKLELSESCKNIACAFLCVCTGRGVFFLLFLDSFKRSFKPTLRSYKAKTDNWSYPPVCPIWRTVAHGLQFAVLPFIFFCLFWVSEVGKYIYIEMIIWDDVMRKPCCLMACIVLFFSPLTSLHPGPWKIVCASWWC